MWFLSKASTFVGAITLAGGLTHAVSLEEINEDVIKDLEAALSELSDLQNTIAVEKIPVAEKLNGLESQVVQKRQELARQQRSADNKLVELNALKTEVKGLWDEHNYVSGLLSEYVRVFETRIHISEVQQYADVINKTKVIMANSDLEVIDKSRQQVALLNASLDRMERLMGGDFFEGHALSPSGVLEQGKFVVIGPIAVFSSKESQSGGLAQLQLGSPEPTVIDLGAETATAVRALVESNSGMLPVDASLGNALKISATKDTLIEHLKKGGPVMVPIVGLGIAAVLIALFKWVRLSQNQLVAPADLQLVLSYIKIGNIQKAKGHAARMRGLVGEVLSTAVENCREKKEYLEEILYERMLIAKPSLESMLPVIALTAATAPLLGLLGTVTGMINTFSMITVFGTGDPRMLSAGISEALITTKFGLVTAIPALICHAIISRKAKGILGSMEQVTVGFINGVPEAEETESEKL
ncbi:MAG: Biopolymer transport protein ExbB [Verrucomicrobia subdivision 3 bacterium]|nr:Biopolymer transport protein ExbB [Limisphaerales bacterium]MCS1414736.1 Biopolymer transport protein ExbB [Limisphaerales bacterium]